MKKLYYPNINKTNLSKLYDIRQLQARHSRGSTVAVTLVVLSPNGMPLQEVDMGTSYLKFLIVEISTLLKMKTPQ